MGKTALAIHGGAGTILRSAMTPELDKEYRDALETALTGGMHILDRGGTSLEAVETAVAILEDFPLFNAGRGSVFTSEGKNEMDAAIMDGSTHKAGAVAFVRNVRNPIKLARLVMEMTEHVLLAGEGANRFAIEAGVELAPDEYFYTEHRWQQLQDAMLAGRVVLDHSAPDSSVFSENEKAPLKPIGTVGAVACDQEGKLAAATSTGGMTNKKFGRIGDTPLIGAGTYADENCAVSCTGHGEYFMLGVTGYDVAARIKYKRMNLADAAQAAVDYLTSIGGEGGLIAVDREGNVTLPFNSDGMYRGWAVDGKLDVSIYAD